MVRLPSSALAIAAGEAGNGIVGPSVTVNVPDAIASLIWLNKCIDNEKSPNWKGWAVGGYDLFPQELVSRPITTRRL